MFSIQNVHSYFLDPVDVAAASFADAAAVAAVAAVAAAADAAVALLCSPISPTLNGPISQRRQKLDCIFSQWLQCHYTAHIMVEMDSVTRFSTLLLIKALQYTWITYTVECR